MNYTQKKIDKILVKHEKWLNGARGGVFADLSGSKLRGLDLSGADLREADLEGAKWENVNLKRAILMEANLVDIVFKNVDLTGANLMWANMRQGEMQGVTLDDADLHFADLSHTTLVDSDFQYADFREASLAKANFTNVNIDNAKFGEANVHKLCGFEIYSVSTVGTFDGNIIYIPSVGKVFAGCWEGSEQEFFDKCIKVKNRTGNEWNLDVAVFMVKKAMNMSYEVVNG